MAPLTYLNTAACGLIAPETLQASNSLYAGFANNSSLHSEQWAQNDEPRIRQVVADFIGAPVNNTALIPNFSWGMNGVVQSLRGTERVLLYRNDFPSLLLPFTVNNFSITWVDAPDGFILDMDAITTAIKNKRVDIVALSHVQWNSGYKADLKVIGDLCREHDVWFFIDATQSLGANVVNLQELNIDVLAASNYKWMNAGFGTGILYVGDRFLAQYPPVVDGFHSDKVRPANAPGATAASYEPGSPNMYGLLLLESAILEKNKTGLHHLQQHNYTLTQLVLNGLAPLPLTIIGGHTMANRCSIVVLKDENGLGGHLAQNNIVVTHRNGLLRVSMDYYNNESDVMRLVEVVRDFYKGGN